jgi:hypothetical protein
LDWYEEALQRKEERSIVGAKYGYDEMAKDFGMTYEAVRRRFRKERKKNAPIRQEVDIHDTLLKSLEKPFKIEEFCAVNKVQFNSFREQIQALVDEGYQIVEHDGIYSLYKDIIPTKNFHQIDWQGNKIIKFGVVSDNHLGSIYQQLTFLHHLYDIFEQEGIERVFNPGDITEGWKMRTGHEFECHPLAYGISAQIDYVVRNYPKKNAIATDFILGNHDLSGLKIAGINIGEVIAKDRPDMIYRGMLNAKIELTPNCIIELNHPLDGATYAISYAPQKYADSMTGGQKPNILLGGHHHKALYLPYRNIHIIETGTTEAQSGWMRGKRIAAVVGGWIITVHVNDEGEIVRFMPEFIPLYKMKDKDW